MVCWLFFNFAVLFDFGCCSLAQEMIFVDCYLLYFRQQLITCLLSAFLLFQPFVYWSSHRYQLLASPPFSCELSASCPLCCVLVFSSLFIQVFFFCRGVSLPRGLCWFIPGVAGEIPHVAWHSPVWSAKCLPGRLRAGIWWWQEPSCFLSVTWCGEAFYGLGVHGVEVLILLGALFPPSVAPESQQGFDLWSSCCLLLHPSCHLGSL
jgi:hypothetical protein